jgi:hypothetical protein
LAHSEELAQGNLHGWFFAVVPVYPQAYGVQLIHTAGMAGHPDVGDYARSLEFWKLKGFSRSEAGHVEVAVVPVGLFVAGDAPIAANGRCCQGPKDVAKDRHSNPLL